MVQLRSTTGVPELRNIFWNTRINSCRRKSRFCSSWNFLRRPLRRWQGLPQCFRTLCKAKVTEIFVNMKSVFTIEKKTAVNWEQNTAESILSNSPSPPYQKNQTNKTLGCRNSLLTTRIYPSRGPNWSLPVLESTNTILHHYWGRPSRSKQTLHVSSPYFCCIKHRDLN